jgi:hypothetical protein
MVSERGWWREEGTVEAPSSQGESAQTTHVHEHRAKKRAVAEYPEHNKLTGNWRSAVIYTEAWCSQKP